MATTLEHGRLYYKGRLVLAAFSNRVPKLLLKQCFISIILLCEGTQGFFTHPKLTQSFVLD